jgi:cysteine synthase A
MGEAQDMGFIREVVRVPGPEAMKLSRQLATQEGIFVGISSGGTFAAALRIAEKAPKGSTILCMLPDTGERYLSTPLFADIAVDMTEEETAISHSTPGFWLPAAK